MKIDKSERRITAVILNCAILINLILTGYLEFYPKMIYILLALFVGATMVLGNLYVFNVNFKTFSKTTPHYNTKHSYEGVPSSVIRSQDAIGSPFV